MTEKKKEHHEEEKKEEEIAQEIEELEKEDKSREIYKTAFKLALGIVFILVGVVTWIGWRDFFIVLLKGCIGPFLIFAGVIAIAIAKE